MEKPKGKLTASRGHRVEKQNMMEGMEPFYMQFQGFTDAFKLNSESSLGLMALRIKCPDLIYLACLVFLMGKQKFRRGKASSLGSLPGRSLNS